MTSRPRTFHSRLLALLAILALLATACGGGDEPAEDPTDEATTETGDAEPEPTEAEESEPKPTLEPAAAEPTEAAPPGTPSPTEELVTDGVPQDPVAGTHSAGTLTVNATRCDLGGVDLVGDSSSSVAQGIAVSGDQIYLIDGESLVYRFIADTSAGCSLNLDSTWGDDGVYVPNEEQSALNIAQATGRLVISGSVFEAEVVDTTTSASYICDVTGEIEITGDGSLGVAYFPGSAIRQVDFTDTGCTETDPAPQAASLPFTAQSILSGQFTTAGEFVVGGTQDVGNVIVAAYLQDGSEVWRQGTEVADDFSDQRYGWVHAISLCGADALCTLDTNFRRLQILDSAGTWLTSVDLNELHGIESAWWEDMEFDDQGRLWMPVGAGRDEGDLNDGFLFLVDITGA